MDINSLLSPQESPPRNTSLQTSNAPKKRGRPAGGKRSSSGLSNEITVSSPPPDPPRSVPQPSNGQGAQERQQALSPMNVSAYASQSAANDVRASSTDSPIQFRSPFSAPQHLRASLANQRASPSPQIESLAGESGPAVMLRLYTDSDRPFFQSTSPFWTTQSQPSTGQRCTALVFSVSRNLDMARLLY